MPAPITLTQASYAAQGRPILHPLTLTLSEPRIGILGQNGSGKTTLLCLLAGFVPPTVRTTRHRNRGHRHLRNRRSLP